MVPRNSILAPGTLTFQVVFFCSRQTRSQHHQSNRPATLYAPHMVHHKTTVERGNRCPAVFPISTCHHVPGIILAVLCCCVDLNLHETAARRELTLLEPRSRSGDKPVKFQAVCPHYETAVLKGLRLVDQGNDGRYSLLHTYSKSVA